MYKQTEQADTYYNHKKFIYHVDTGRRTKMKVTNITNINALFNVIDSCTGKVELVTGEGDRLNLKSKLSQYVALANVFSDGKIDELEIIAYEPEDVNKLINFMYNG
jgi:hypothetical protein